MLLLYICIEGLAACVIMYNYDEIEESLDKGFSLLHLIGLILFLPAIVLLILISLLVYFIGMGLIFIWDKLFDIKIVSKKEKANVKKTLE